MRIALYLTCYRGWGGTYQYASSLVDSLVRLAGTGHTVRIFCTNDSWRDILRQKKISFTLLHKQKIGELFFYKIISFFNFLATNIPKKIFPKFVYAVLQAQHFHGWVINSWKPNVCICAQQDSLPLAESIAQITVIHDLMHRYETSFSEACSPEEYVAREELFTLSIARAKYVFVESDLGKRQVMQSYHAPSAQIKIVPLCAPKLLLDVVPERPANLPLSLQTYLFYPAQFWKHKNHENLLKSLLFLQDLDISVVFVGATDKNGYDPCIQLIREFDLEKRVVILDYVVDAALAWLYKHARCFVMPTFFGPTNIPPLEAAYFGCPMALSNNYAMPEQMGDAALYFDPSSPEEIAQAIRVLWTDEAERERLICAGHNVSAEWTPDDFEKKVCEIILSLRPRSLGAL